MAVCVRLAVRLDCEGRVQVVFALAALAVTADSRYLKDKMMGFFGVQLLLLRIPA